MLYWVHTITQIIKYLNLFMWKAYIVFVTSANSIGNCQKIVTLIIRCVFSFTVINIVYHLVFLYLRLYFVVCLNYCILHENCVVCTIKTSIMLRLSISFHIGNRYYKKAFVLTGKFIDDGIGKIIKYKIGKWNVSNVIWYFM